MTSGSLRWLGPLVLVLMLVACGGGDQEELRAYISRVKQKSPEPIPPLPSVQPPESFVYSAAGLRDPFTGGPDTEMKEPEPVVPGTGDGPKPDGHRQELLEAFELDSLKMVGTLEIRDEHYGLVTDPNGLVHRVQLENYLGRHFGRVYDISEDRIKIQELIPNGAGGWQYREVSLALDDS